MTTTPQTPDPIQSAELALTLAASGLTDIERQLAAIRSERAAQAGVLTGVRDQLDAALARIRELEGTGHRMRLGACPRNLGVDGFDPRAVADVPTRFPGATVRLFENLNHMTTAPWPPGDVDSVTVSWALEPSQRPTVAECHASFANIQRGRVARNHELDAKVRKGTYSLGTILPAMDHWAEVAKEARPDLDTIMIFTGWLFSPAGSAPGKAERDKYGPTARRYKRVGVDLDGVHNWPYPNYLPHIPNIVRFLDDFDIEFATIEEQGWSRNPTNDPDGRIRMAKYVELLEALRETGRVELSNAYVYEGVKGNDFTTAEAAAYRDLVAEWNGVSS